MTQRRDAVLYGLFVLSGLAGLIYESIWSHYLKLILGHAAYAQALVLCLFMGGMTLGAALCSRWSDRLRNPLMVYALVEAVLGVAGLAFHALFVAAEQWYFGTALGLGWPGGLQDLLRMVLCTVLVLPQAVLLGTTFPLIAAAVCRRHSDSGRVLSWLYFANSIGAAVGVLLSGFVLIRLLGMPGTVMTAGLLNLGIALVVWQLAKAQHDAPLVRATTGGAVGAGRDLRLLAMVAAITGLASFCYEIGWIRMLSLVLGAATHSFELMLSAFIAGLAIGALAIRRHIDTVANPMRLLAIIQILMPLFALGSTALYPLMFDWMGGFLRSLEHNAGGYALYTLYSHGLCFLLMLPTTICAGMTLPLVTRLCLTAGGGERSIGQIYAWNTLGSIAGVLLAAMLVMPLLGLKAVILTGVVADLAIGLVLLRRAGGDVTAATPVAALAAIAAVALIPWRPEILHSGVFRHAQAHTKGPIQFERHGRSASVAVFDSGGGRGRSIVTNGKVDATIRSDVASQDDFTMILLGSLGFEFTPEVTRAAVIGMGSGRSSHVLLHAPELERLDTIEIEPAMIEGARLFGDAVARTFDDPRSHIVIDDAKAHFARSQLPYDLIVSEPSNPWVSGVASLFTEEFYTRVKHYLSADGVFVQWMHLYEIDVDLVASILKAIDGSFVDYQIYSTNGLDTIIVAADRPLPVATGRLADDPRFAAFTSWLNFDGPGAIQRRFVASREQLAPWLDGILIPVNSDYFPVLDQQAARQRFLQADAASILSFARVAQRWPGRPEMAAVTDPQDPVPMVAAAAQSRRFLNYFAAAGAAPEEARGEMLGSLLASGRAARAPLPDGLWRNLLEQFMALNALCDQRLAQTRWNEAYQIFMREVLPYAEAPGVEAWAAEVSGADCVHLLDQEQMSGRLRFASAVAGRRWDEVMALAPSLLPQELEGRVLPAWLAREWLLAAVHAGVSGELLAELKQNRLRMPIEPELELLGAYAASQSPVSSGGSAATGN